LRSLGIHFNSPRQNLAAEEDVPLVGRQGLEAEFNGFLDVGDRLFQRGPLRLAALQLSLAHDQSPAPSGKDLWGGAPAPLPAPRPAFSCP